MKLSRVSEITRVVGRGMVRIFGRAWESEEGYYSRSIYYLLDIILNVKFQSLYGYFGGK